MADWLIAWLMHIGLFLWHSQGFDFNVVTYFIDCIIDWFIRWLIDKRVEGYLLPLTRFWFQCCNIIDWLVDWLINWFLRSGVLVTYDTVTVWLVLYLLIDWLVDWLIDWLFYCLIYAERGICYQCHGHCMEFIAGLTVWNSLLDV